VVLDATLCERPLSVGAAAIKLDISTTPFVVFHNTKEGRLNVVYRRPDGNIGWLDPRATARA